MVAIHRRSDREGFAVTVALIIAAVALAAAAMLAGALRHRTWELSQEERSLHLTALCDAGVAQALARLSIDPGWEGVADEQLDNGVMTIAVRRVDRTNRIVVVRSTYRTGRRSVEVDVQLSSTRTPRVVRWRRLPDP